MADQQFFNIVVAVCGALGGFILKAVWDGLKDLRASDGELARRIASIEVLVAGEYVKRDNFEQMVTALFAKLDKIEDKLNGKQDKHP